MENIIINREGNYRDETVSSVPLGINNINISSDRNFDIKKDEISNIKPMLSNNSNRITIPEGKKIKIKPILNKKVPSNTFSMMANPRKNMGGHVSEESSYSSQESEQSDTNEILTNNSRDSRENKNYSNSFVEEHDSEDVEDAEETEDDDSDDGEEGDDADDYSSINSDVKKNKKSEDYTEDDEMTEASQPKKQKTYEEIQQEKQKLLFNLERLQKQGFPPSKRYTMASSYEDMLFEHDRLKRQRDVEKSIKFSRKILMAIVSGVEFLNGKFDPFDIRLDGWSENIMENVNDYDEVFEELHDKYSDSVKMAPELKLIAMVAGSGFMFHLTNSLFKSATPKMADILKQNPDIMKNITEAAAKNMGNTINQNLGANDFVGNMMKEGINMKMNQQRGPVGPVPQPSNIPNMFKGTQPKMNGPVDIDELLNELNSNNDDGSVSSNGSVNMKSSAKRTTKQGQRKGGIQLDLR
jgi:hypothetical protein